MPRASRASVRGAPSLRRCLAGWDGRGDMALTLTEGAKLSNDVLLEGVIETVINDSPVLQQMPFIEIVGNGLTYNRENAAATAGAIGKI